ncbi:hypothetical protein CcCBS67573_g05281 [Chytriomyces confervae]|uniref:Serine/threonine-protein kinase RIO2 n=1 Tax=Chytriomyces confervae TaxID=246404 RepID=A0A507FAU2_9FUNG|nr:hypothetical protein CcCBS67573_g05281 [Chytriomyces confervae]
MKLDAKLIRYLSSEDYRVLTATEMGSRNHEVVPTALIGHIASLKHGGTEKYLSHLAKHNLVARTINARYDGYRLTYGGYDYLALKTMSRRGSVTSVGNQIGVGKESDIYIVANDEQEQRVLKIHRLGRISFRTIKSKRDYLQNRKTGSWQYMARLAAMKEFAFMKVLHENGFPVPTPFDCNRHCIVMSLIDAFPLCQIREVDNPGRLYSKLMDLIVRLACAGLIHGDFNEFNILVGEDGEPVLIDFPQMVSTSHRNAEMYFNRDVDCIRTFFRRRFDYESSIYPKFSRDAEREFSLDVQVAASGFTRKHQQELEQSDDDNEDQEVDADDAVDYSNLSQAKVTFKKGAIEMDNGDGFPSDEIMKLNSSVESLSMNPDESCIQEPASQSTQQQQQQNIDNNHNSNNNSDNDSEEEEEEDDEIFENVNKSIRPHRDPIQRLRSSSPTPSKASSTTGNKMNAEEIRQRVKRGMMGKSARAVAKSGSKGRNQVKHAGKREASQAAKEGKGHFWA